MTPTDSPEVKKIEAMFCEEPGSHPNTRNVIVDSNKAPKSKQGAITSVADSDSQVSGASTKKGLRLHLTEITEPLMAQAMCILSQ